MATNSSMGTGGPYEPVATHADMSHSEITHSSTMNDSSPATGGPTEERTGYPACDPGPSDDRCIQLYERGVTGAGS